MNATKVTVFVLFVIVSLFGRYAESAQCSRLVNKDIGGPSSVKSGQPESKCCSLCSQDKACKGWVWGPWGGGTCYLKHQTSSITNKNGVISGVLQKTTPKPTQPPASGAQCSRLVNKDIGGPSSVKSGQPESKCCSLCSQDKACKGWVWGPWGGGTCYLKHQTNSITNKNGVISGVLQKTTPKPTQPPVSGGQCSRLVGKDIQGPGSEKHGYKESQCCGLCSKDFACKGFVWGPWNGGTCYLKHQTHSIVSNPGVVSGVLQGDGGHTSPTRPPTTNHGKLIFNEQFNSLNKGLWKHSVNNWGGGNGEVQYYSDNPKLSYVRDGILYLRAAKTSDILGNENAAPSKIMAARLDTKGTFSCKYGRVEVRAKLPVGDWLWPAIWLLPRDKAYGTWPRSGEIDIMESRGNRNYPRQNGGGVESFGSALHFGPDWQNDHYWAAHKTYSLRSGTFNDQFHTFGLVWTADRLYTYLDYDANRILDVPTGAGFWQRGRFNGGGNPWANAARNAPFDKEFYIILNLAVDGGYFAPGVAGRYWANGDKNAFYNARSKWGPTWQGEKSALQIDSVKVWAL